MTRMQAFGIVMLWAALCSASMLVYRCLDGDIPVWAIMAPVLLPPGAVAAYWVLVTSGTFVIAMVENRHMHRRSQPK